MKESPQIQEQLQQQYVRVAVEIAIKLGVLALLVYISFLIVQPFLSLILWSVILAVAFFPVVEMISSKLSLSRKQTVIALALLFNVALIVPTYMVSDKAVESIGRLSEVAKKGEVHISPPPVSVKEWPIIGNEVFGLWQKGSQDMNETLKRFAPQIKEIAAKTVHILGEALGVVILSMISVVIAIFLIINAETYADFYTRVSVRLIGKKGEEWAKLTALTIRSVANGVIGVAVIQAALALVGMLAMHIPFSVVLALALMFLTIAQLPAFFIIGPVIAYVLSHDTSATAIAFSIYMLIVGSVDGVLKPILMGRGVNIPMPVILVGAIGGMLLMGLIGLFVGAVIFALMYKLVLLWMNESALLKEGAKNS